MCAKILNTNTINTNYFQNCFPYTETIFSQVWPRFNSIQYTPKGMGVDADLPSSSIEHSVDEGHDGSL